MIINPNNVGKYVQFDGRARKTYKGGYKHINNWIVETSIAKM